MAVTPTEELFKIHNVTLVDKTSARVMCNRAMVTVTIDDTSDDRAGLKDAVIAALAAKRELVSFELVINVELAKYRQLEDERDRIHVSAEASGESVVMSLSDDSLLGPMLRIYRGATEAFAALCHTCVELSLSGVREATLRGERNGNLAGWRESAEYARTLQSLLQDREATVHGLDRELIAAKAELRRQQGKLNTTKHDLEAKTREADMYECDAKELKRSLASALSTLEWLEKGHITTGGRSTRKLTLDDVAKLMAAEAYKPNA